MDMMLRGKRALVTCGTSGIGRECAATLSREGVEVVVISRTGTSQTEGVTSIHVDLTEPAALSKALENIGPVDILIFIPPREVLGGFLDFEAADFRRAFDNTFFPYVELVRNVLPGMLARRFGRVISIFGASTLAPLWNHALSNVSRAASASLGSGLAREVGAQEVTFNTLLLGPYDTPGLSQLWKERAHEAGITYDEYATSRSSAIPTGKLGNPEGCAALCTLLASPMMWHLTGQSLRLDGGQQLGI